MIRKMNIRFHTWGTAGIVYDKTKVEIKKLEGQGYKYFPQ